MKITSTSIPDVLTFEPIIHQDSRGYFMETFRQSFFDSYGLDRMDRKILQVIKDYYNGGPVGIESLCATLNEDRGT